MRQQVCQLRHHQVYSDHIYSEYARDLAERTTHLPVRVAGDMLRHPTQIVKWPFKALRKPFGLLREVNQVTAFEQSRNRAPDAGAAGLARAGCQSSERGFSLSPG